MSATPAQLAANAINAQASTGPRTPAGLSASSKNATTNGLYATHDFIRSGEAPLYEELNDSLLHDLAPVGMLESSMVDEIRRAMWRLRRCGLIEESFASSAEISAEAPDPMQVEAQAKVQLSVDRARSQAHRLLHKCTAELRKLQTERVYRNEAFDEGTDISGFGICDWPSIETRLNRNTIAGYRSQNLEAKARLKVLLKVPTASDGDSASFCKSRETPSAAA